MANIAKIKRDRMLAFLEELKLQHNDDESIRAFNEIENHIRDKKYGLVWEEHTEQVDEMLEENIPIFREDSERKLCKSSSLPYNFIIEGDNLQALYLLAKTHRGKVDCIYIDPPYNTGARDWKYNNDYVDSNDVYRHSKWLSMMDKRLTLAKHLLNPDNSVLMITIDDNELCTLKLLLESIFPSCNMQIVDFVINPKGKARIGRLSQVDEYLIIVYVGEAKTLPEKSFVQNEEIRWPYLRRSDVESARGTTKGGTQQFYPIYVDTKTDKIVKIGTPLTPSQDLRECEQIKDAIAVFPIREDGKHMNWGLTPESLQYAINNECVRVTKSKNPHQAYNFAYVTIPSIKKVLNGTYIVSGYREDGTKIITLPSGKESQKTTAWKKTSYDANAYGTKLIGQILKEKRFSFPKSLYSVYDSLKIYLEDKKEALIVDFFAGSGTTLHAINLLNAEDDGKRRCIMVTNNEVSETEAKNLAKQGYKPGDPEWEKLGIAQHVTWPRTICSIEGKDVDGKPLEGNYLTTTDKEFPMKKGFVANVKYLKCDWTPRKPEDYLLSNVLCLHIKEMIELQNGYEIDGIRNVLILTKDDFNKAILDETIYKQIENIWLNQNMILNAEEMKLLTAKGFKYIPREFFGKELREAAE